MMCQDFKLQMQINTRLDYSALGLSFTTAAGLAIADEDPSYNWRAVWPPTANDLRIMRQMGIE